MLKDCQQKRKQCHTPHPINHTPSTTLHQTTPNHTTSNHTTPHPTSSDYSTSQQNHKPYNHTTSQQNHNPYNPITSQQNHTPIKLHTTQPHLTTPHTTPNHITLRPPHTSWPIYYSPQNLGCCLALVAFLFVASDILPVEARARYL
ncbi:hypothetical protein Pmani_036589 [Petrolisthes manimaculis]|uniref:Uncharacterized protein n=1 Tax=Petrolisthes manimaculis TaxID=1843537 RepID=A0AAE1NJF6_9EUCA|nr:hypothetical protein Pmani_036589 [Petrolisthes manimaculis]